jgi:hypothetical protein
VSALLRSAWSALGLFLRGFTGVAARPAVRHDDTDPRSIRDALADQASRRGRCC